MIGAIAKINIKGLFYDHILFQNRIVMANSDFKKSKEEMDIDYAQFEKKLLEIIKKECQHQGHI